MLNRKFVALLFLVIFFNQSIHGRENNCDFTAGCLAGVHEGLLQQPYSVAEEMVGGEERVFTFEIK